MKRLKAIVDRALELAVAAVMAVLVLDVLWQVFTRFILLDPSSWTEELARYLLIWVGLLGAAYAAGRRMHLALDLLPSKLTGVSQKRLEIFIELCAFGFALFALVIGGVRLVMVTLVLGQTSAALQLPIGIVYLVVPLSGILIMFYSACHIIEVLTAQDGQSTERARGVA
jgi:TRAP-type C4-dicarboxylate transport system permease small subunit